jgi:pentatricopeptide repeat protein
MCDAITDAQAAGLQLPAAAFEALVFAHASASRHHEAIEAFSRVEDEFGCRPTTFVYNAVLRALVNTGVVPVALALYNRMVATVFSPNRVLTVLTTKTRPSKPQVRAEYMTSFMHILGTNKVPRVVL